MFDLTAAYGLDTPPPATYHEVTGLDESTVMPDGSAPSSDGGCSSTSRPDR